MYQRYAVIALLLVVLLIAACDANGIDVSSVVVQGSGTVVTESREVSGFTGVKLETGAAITIDVSGSESLTLTSDDNIVELLTTEVQGSMLVIRTRDGEGILPTNGLSISITAAALDRLEVTGGGSFNISGVSGENFRVNVTGAADITVSGEVTRQNLTFSGGGAYNGFELATEETTINLTGGATLNVDASRRLDVTISGAGVITYEGEPEITRNITGVGQIRPR